MKLASTHLELTARNEGRARGILLSPGPTNVHTSVWEASLRGWMTQKSSEARQLLAKFRSGLQTWLPFPHDFSIVFGGSGTAACEAMIGLTVGARILLIENGRYSRRLGTIATRVGAAVNSLSLDDRAPFDPALVERAAVELSPSAILVAWHETERGILNPVGELSEVAARMRLPLLIDGVSGVGAHALNLSPSAEIVMAFSSNKALESLPGLACVAGHRSVLSKLQAAPRSLYLDIRQYLQDQDSNAFSFTPPVPALFAGQQALSIALSETYQSRVERYRRRISELRRALQPYAEIVESTSNVVSLVRLPSAAHAASLESTLAGLGLFAHTSPALLGEGLVSISMMGALTDFEVSEVIGKICLAVRTVVA